MKDPIKVARGRSARVLGADFERRVRIDLEGKGWIVDKWSNNLFPLHDLPVSIGCKFKIAAAKHKMGPKGTPLAIGTGFPDFIVYKVDSRYNDICYTYSDEKDTYGPVCLIGVESKVNGTLSAIEKEKCRWYLKNNIFSKILISEKTKEKGKIVIVYHDFEEKYGS